MDNESQYFLDCDEWSHQEREFANRAVHNIGLNAWHDLLRVQRLYGKEAFLSAIRKIWPDGTPPEEKP